jgi:hypothetical protein
MKTKKTQNQYYIDWHPAFVEALQMELKDYRDMLEFRPECQLTSGPLRIDYVVIKKAKNVVIKKNIAVIFREWNLLEYKNPNGYISIADYYKVYGYACLYASFNKVPITNLTLSFVESRYPRKLLAHLQEVRGYTVEEKWPGVYIISGDILPIQIIDSRKLSAGENLWLRTLSNKLEYQAVIEIGKEASRQRENARLGAFLDVITRANPKAVKEAIKMGKKLTLDEVLIESGLTAEWEARGREKVARNALAQGLEPEFVQKITGLDIQTITSLTSSAHNKRKMKS